MSESAHEISNFSDDLEKLAQKYDIQIVAAYSLGGKNGALCKANSELTLLGLAAYARHHADQALNDSDES